MLTVCFNSIDTFIVFTFCYKVVFQLGNIFLYMHPPFSEKKQKQVIISSQNTVWTKLKGYFCPCLLSKTVAPLQNLSLKNELLQTSSVHSKYDSQLTKKEMRGEVAKMQMLRNTPKIRRGSYGMRQVKEQSQQKKEQDQQQWRSQNSYRGTMQLEKFHMNRVKFKEQMDLTIWNLNQQQLTIVGSNNHSILVRVAPIKLKPNFGKLKQIVTRSSTKFSLRSKSQKTKDTAYKNYEFDRFWEDRYMFFDKFDQGIKIDEESWSTLPPECVSEYIASKFTGRRSVLDAFAGVGAVSIKFATINSFQKVVSNQSNRQKLSFLLNNATIYQVESYLQLSNRQFLKLQRGNFDTVFVQPPLANLQARSNKGISLNDFSPSLDDIIKKSMGLSANMILLLPPETNIEQVCGSISRWGSNLKWMKDFCSASIEKIYWDNQLKYILLCVGKQIQTEIKLNDELDFIYNKLRNWNDRFFKQKKIVKKIREDHGMIELLNALQRSQLKKRQFYHHNPKYSLNIPLIQFFYEVILERNLISGERLNKIKLQQEENYDKKESMVGSWGITQQKTLRVSPSLQEQKIQENPTILRQAQLTSSQYSYISYFETLSKSSRHKEELLRRGNTLQSSKGVVIKRNPLSSYHNEYSRQNTGPISEKDQQKEIKEQQCESSSKKRSSQTKQKPEGYLSKRISKQT